MPSNRKPASSPVETEAKIRVSSFTAIRRRISSSGGCLLSPRALEANTLFDSPERSLTAQGRSFRVRRYGTQGLLTLKGAARVSGGIKSRVELETQVTSPEIVVDILISLGFLPQFRYEKFREVWGLRGTSICLDETPLGRFVEIEGPVAAIHRVASLIEVSPEDFLTASYPALWFAAGRTDDMAFASRARSRKTRA